jgi:predicted amidophosphoribosyltransferase
VVASRIVDDLLGALFPTICPCGARGEPCCDACAATLRGAPIMPAPPGVEWWVAPYAYEGVARELVARAKYRNGRAALAWFGAAVASVCAQRIAPAVAARAFDIITWAPASVLRRRTNGVDHGAVLARAVARRLDVPAGGLLIRDAGVPQTGADRDARRRGPGLRVHLPVAGHRVLLIDDVATTGATLSAAACALRGAGAVAVYAATAARTPGPGRG